MINVLIPASGKGSRNQFEGPIKELILRPSPRGPRALIEFTFDHFISPTAYDFLGKIIVITRAEKLQALKRWWQVFEKNISRPLSVEFIVHEPIEGQEWPSTLLSSHKFWAEKNLVMLPDTQLMLHNESPSLIELANAQLDSLNTFWLAARKPIEEVKSFGMLTAVEKGISIVEKPRLPTSSLVWAAFAFRKPIGKKLLEDLEQSTRDHGEIFVPEPSGFVEVKSFEDLSRDSKTPCLRQGSKSSHS